MEIVGFNAARSIVCVETYNMSGTHYFRLSFQCRTQHCVCRDLNRFINKVGDFLFQCRTQHCVCRDKGVTTRSVVTRDVSMPHAALCVSRQHDISNPSMLSMLFQCRTQHCVCRDVYESFYFTGKYVVSMPHAALCVSRLQRNRSSRRSLHCFNAARSIVCVETRNSDQSK